MRIDKWLWTARLFKTRGLAARAVTGGRVHVNGAAVKPSRPVGPGDELEVTIGSVRRTLIIRGAAERRRQAELRRLAGPIDLGARPTKRDRRRYDARRH